MKIIKQDINNVVDGFNSEMLSGKTVFVTGGTGLIGKTMVPVLQSLGAKVILLVRSEEKSRTLFGDTCTYYIGAVEAIPVVDDQIDYIIHMASPTSSSFFINNPVETMQTAIQGTKNILELAKQKKVKGLVYLSSMEVYGYPKKGHAVKEQEVSGFDTRVPRNSYPLSKLTCEMMCNAYAAEYDVPAKVVRLTQTFGAGVEYKDGRVFAEFMRCAMEKRNIVLHTTGETERCYLYTADAVAAIITVLLKGNKGEVYNVANPDTYCSIRKMAELAADIGGVSVDFEIDSIQRGYADALFSMLDVSKMLELGWTPKVALREMFNRMIAAQSD